MDGEVTFRFVKLADDQAPSHEGGAARLGGEPNGPAMGKVTARRGHQVLLPKGAAYQLSAAQARGGDRPDQGRAGDGQALVADLHAGLRRTAMDAITTKIAATGTESRHRLHQLQASAASNSPATSTSRTSSWPKGSHIIEIDRFLRAMVRDIGWGSSTAGSSSTTSSARPTTMARSTSSQAPTTKVTRPRASTTSRPSPPRR